MFSESDLLNPFQKTNPEAFVVSKYRESLVEYLYNQDLPKRNYQVVILAAGQGRRMALDYPKVLYQLHYPGGRASLLDNTLTMVNSLKDSAGIGQVHLVINENDRTYYENQDFALLVNIVGLSENDIRGTAVCINFIKHLLDSDKGVIFIWGDLALWRASDIDIATKVQASVNSCIVFPTRIKINPYVAFLRSKDGKVFKVVHSNESERFQEIAEQDCLSFVCSYNSLSLLDEFISDFLIGQKSLQAEVDFIHYIPYLVSKGESVLGIPIAESGLVYGLNTPERAQEINGVLSRYSSIEYEQYFVAT